MSYENRTVADQQPALAVLAQIGAAFPHLPGAVFNVSRLDLDEVTVSLHDDLGDFEAWRIALGVPASAVGYRTQPGNTVLTATVEWGGGTVELVGYGPLPQRDVERGEPS
ncbi:MAG: hypothetical protein HOW97_08005 [Catenulispora sp.]|nr:hypothetical protein [Catenulispora sp.]